MNLQKFIISMVIGSFISLFAWIVVLLFINPTESGPVLMLLFYFSLGLTVLGFFTIFGFMIRKFSSKKEPVFGQVIVSFRQALWISIVLIVSLFLQSRGLLNWVNEILFILALALIEFFCLSTKNNEIDSRTNIDLHSN